MVKRVFAIVGIVVILALYVATIVVSLMGDELNMNLLVAAFAATVIVPLVLLIFVKGTQSVKKNKQNQEKQDK